MKIWTKAESKALIKKAMESWSEAKKAAFAQAVSRRPPVRRRTRVEEE